VCTPDSEQLNFACCPKQDNVTLVYCDDASVGNCCNPPSEDNKSNKDAIIAGAVVGGVLGALLLAFLIYVLYYRCIGYKKKSNVKEEDVRNKIGDSSSGTPKQKDYNY